MIILYGGAEHLAFAASFQVFMLERQELVRLLRDLPAEDWTRAAHIAGRRHTVYSQVRRLALHEREHCAQLEALLQPAD